jgi:DNA-directed RNA polymerase subunit RPC12/RpoP
MEDFSVEIRCIACGRNYPVALRKMRLNIHNACPACGFQNGISQGDAIRAQRLLERLELEERVRAKSPDRARPNNPLFSGKTGNGDAFGGGTRYHPLLTKFS